MTEQERIANSIYFEGMTSIRAILKGNELGLNNRRIQTLYFDKDSIKTKKREHAFIKKMSELYSFPIEYIDREIINSMSVGTSHGGIIAKCTERYISTSLPSTLEEKKFSVLLDGIEDPFNFGYSLRSLYAFGVDCVILPERNWMSAASIVCRSSAGASELCEMYSCNPESAVNHYKKLGACIISTAKENSTPISDVNITFPLLLIVGGEKRGISKSILALSDHIARIDYGRDFMSSLSAASASAILGYEISQKANRV